MNDSQRFLVDGLSMKSNEETPQASSFGGQEESLASVYLWEPVQLRQEWTIHNIGRALELSTPGICMRSRGFRDESMPDITWQLCLYPGGKREENKGNISLFLKMSTSHTTREFTIRAEYCFYFMDDQGKSRFSNVNTGDFKVKPSKGSHSWGLRNIPKQKVLNSVRADDSLHVVAIIETVPDFNKIQTTVVRKENSINQSQLTKDYLSRLNSMFVTGEGSDFSIECEGRTFSVHKFILMAHSDVFRAMFKHSNTVESRDSKLILTDTNPVAVNQMLTYMYSGSLPENFLDEHAPALMQIAEKYALDPLKLLCQDKLISRLNGNNVCLMLEIADAHNAEVLMEACIPMVRAFGRRIINSTEWADMRNCNPQLVTKVLEKIVTFEDSSPPNKRQRLAVPPQFTR